MATLAYDTTYRLDPMIDGKTCSVAKSQRSNGSDHDSHFHGTFPAALLWPLTGIHLNESKLDKIKLS